MAVETVQEQIQEQEQEEDIDFLQIKGYITDNQGNKISAIVDIEELRRVGELIEDHYCMRILAERKDEPTEDYEEYSAKRRAEFNVQTGA
ncbi:MAG: hypothetical protein SFH39_12870 [Candidatus Magnetobacterium sp. LHC-1]|uniref:Uncharacterized protein n=1 Tax=Candidatus Magnetobacterium casense TaxID=1455061 RepID=A0ABS6S0Q6_9BACT|nr:hypothetical protein [Candidatus Magnetobacterium casensis]MBF0606762.1 hypothetical protein [Nitrospirota bacterium]MBV6342432.1 hypothetical protein [Candidatus Magnetobacterium casensis]